VFEAAAKVASFFDIGGPGGLARRPLRYGQSKRLCGFQINDQFVLGRRLHRLIGRLYHHYVRV
jgi:hypothetical protein